MRQKVLLKILEPKDLRQFVQVHVDSFPESALTKLGPAIVERYYSWQLTGPHKKVRAMGAYVAGECAGFSFSGVFSGSTSGFIRQNRGRLIMAVLLHPRLVANPLFLQRLIEGVRLLSRSFKKARATGVKAAPRGPGYGILSIAVSPRFQRLGIGQLLMHDAEDEALRCGHQEICLTVHPENEKAVRFYEKQKWQKFASGDSWKGAMTKTLNQVSGADSDSETPQARSHPQNQVPAGTF